MTKDEYRRRIAALRGLASVFKDGRLSAGQSGGSGGMLFLTTPEGKEWFIGGVGDQALAHAVAEVVNLALDLSDRREGEPAGDVGLGHDRRDRRAHSRGP
ncbi:MAG TPA: hypothetical protein VNI54_04655 [Thermoanaerobaculia bacterium]|nr:hypothetical protein [Thermoanaerobaculia bacterium]